MSYTLAQIKTMIEDECDTAEEIFVTPAELLSYINEGIRKAEAIIHNLYEDYFISTANLNLINGTYTYSLPSDIYANKIRLIKYMGSSISERYKINKIKDLDEVDKIVEGCPYKYYPINTSALGQQIELYPTPNVSLAAGVKIYYLRCAKQLVNDSDVCDIPVFINYIVQFAKYKIYKKIPHPLTDIEAASLKEIETEMRDSLSNMVDDGDTTILQDISIYKEMN